MAEHVHEWTHNGFDYEDGASCAVPDCKEWLSTEEITRRLNATERLSAEDAQRVSQFVRLDDEKILRMWSWAHKALDAYATAREDPDGR